VWYFILRYFLALVCLFSLRKLVLNVLSINVRTILNWRVCCICACASVLLHLLMTKKQSLFCKYFIDCCRHYLLVCTVGWLIFWWIWHECWCWLKFFSLFKKFKKIHFKSCTMGHWYKSQNKKKINIWLEFRIKVTNLTIYIRTNVAFIMNALGNSSNPAQNKKLQLNFTNSELCLTVKKGNWSIKFVYTEDTNSPAARYSSEGCMHDGAWVHVGQCTTTECLLSDFVFMLCIYVASNQMSTHSLDLLLGTKQDTSETRPGLDICRRFMVCMCTDLLRAASPLEINSCLKPAAGHCRTSGMCTWRRKKVPGQPKKGEELLLLILNSFSGK